MDLFDYAGELLDRHGKLSIPGLGNFAQKRKSSYYDNGSLYPPSYKVNFTQNLTEDSDEFINYFARQKNISAASSKYFVNKFVDQLKERAADGEANFADIGIFHTENGELIFQPKQSDLGKDPELFGLAPVKIQKLADRKDQSPVIKPTLEIESTETIPDPAHPLTSADIKENELADESQETISAENSGGSENRQIILNSAIGREQTNNNKIFAWTLFAALALIIAGAGIWYYTTHIANDRVGAANSNANTSLTAAKTKQKPAPVALKPDTDTLAGKTLSKDSVAPTTANKAAASTPQASAPASQPAAATVIPAAAELPKDSWVVSGGQNNNYASAGRQVVRYRALGYPQAHMIDSVKKKDYFVYRIIFGSYDTRQQAVAARTRLLRERKLKPKYITVQPLNKDK